MRTIRLATLTLLSLLIAGAVATPLKRQITSLHQQMHAAREIEATTPYTVQAKTGYPAAGFRPGIPFELPNERKPKKLPDAPSISTTEAVTTGSPVTSTGADSTNVDVEVLVHKSDEEETVKNKGNTNEVEQTEIETVDTKDTAESEVEVQVEVNTEVTETEVNAHTPAIEYGPPEVESSTDVVGDEKIEKPAERFQPPNKDAEEFVIPLSTVDGNAIADAGNAGSMADVDASYKPVADFPTKVAEITPTGVAVDASRSGAGPIDVSSELEAEAAEQPTPFATYGPPLDGDNAHLPAETYRAPGDEVVPPEVEEEDFGVELSELEAKTTKEEADLAAEQIDLLSGFSELQSGRLIFVPSDGSNLHQIFFAAPPQQRRAKKSERLVLF